MSDEEIPFPFNMMPIPEEVRAQIVEQRALMQAAYDDHQHRIYEFMDTLKPEQQETLIQMFDHVNHIAVIPDVIAWRTVLSMKLATAKDVCPVCDKDHNAEMDKSLQEFMTPLIKQTPEAQSHESVSDDAISQPASYESASAKTSDLMNEYDVAPANIAQALSRMIPVICIKCGMRYNSLKDRMLQEPGVKGCQGCQHKAKWG